MERPSRSVAAAVALIAMMTGFVQGAPPALADPPGTVELSELREPSTVRVWAATEAGLAYVTDSAAGGAAQVWLAAPGAPPVRAAFPAQFSRLAMAGRMLFDDRGPTVRYAEWDGPVRSCPVADLTARLFLPTGWAYIDRNRTGAVMLVDATPTGCVTRTFLAVSARARGYEVLGGDAVGLVVRTTYADGTVSTGFHHYADPTRPVILDGPTYTWVESTRPQVQVQAGAVLLAASTGSPARMWRIPLDGTPATELPPEPDWEWQAMTSTATAQVSSAGFSVLAVGSTVARTVPGVTGWVASDGTRFYTTEANGEPPGIYERSVEPGSDHRVVAPPTTIHPTRQYGIALSPGRVYYTNWNGPAAAPAEQYDVMMRTVSGSNSVVVGSEQTIREDVRYASVSASAGRLVFNGNLQRTYTGRILPMKTLAATPPEASGNRWLIHWHTDLVDSHSFRTMYDVRTGRTVAELSWPQGAQDLFGNHLLYARDDRSIRLRNLVTGAESQLRGVGEPIAAVALHTRWAAWVTACKPRDVLCAQKLTVRDLSTGRTRTFNTRWTTSLDLSGGYVGLDATWYTQRLLRVIRADTGAVTVIGSLPERASDGSGRAAGPGRHFDLEDELIGWIDGTHIGRVARLPRTIDPPRYLGNAIAPATFSSTWSLAVPVSKALPRCTVRFYRGSTLVRVLNGATASGMVAVTWDGRTGSGAAVPARKYTWQVSGTDDDRYWLRDADGRLRVVSGTVTRTR